MKPTRCRSCACPLTLGPGEKRVRCARCVAEDRLPQLDRQYRVARLMPTLEQAESAESPIPRGHVRGANGKIGPLIPELAAAQAATTGNSDTESSAA